MAALRAMGTLAAQGCRPSPPCCLAPHLGRMNTQLQLYKQQPTARAAFAAAAGRTGKVPPASRAPAKQLSASSGSGEARALPRVVLKGGKSKLFTGESPSPMVSSVRHGVRQKPAPPCNLHIP